VLGQTSRIQEAHKNCVLLSPSSSLSVYTLSLAHNAFTLYQSDRHPTLSGKLLSSPLSFVFSPRNAVLQLCDNDNNNNTLLICTIKG